MKHWSSNGKLRWLLGVVAVSLAAAEAPPVPEVAFIEATAAAKVSFRHQNGATPEKYMPETMGAGGLFFDFDNDGWLDIFLVNSGSLADARVAKATRHGLFRNRGDGTFEDVSAGSGLARHGYPMGACAADFDNDG
ncbi:MAG: FG-GAP repeat domain-containing protein, partial [Candidatus Acidiferrales bacterium]